jgi:hypothetical protein
MLILQVAIFSLGTTTAIGGTTNPNSDAPFASAREDQVLNILSVLENRMGEQQLLQRVKDKLLTLGDGQIQLIASFSDRVVREKNTTGSDIAFLLMTALITLL